MKPGGGGGTLPAGVVHVQCGNAGPMTLSGTNSYIVRVSAGRVVVIDPGPRDEAHCARLVEAVAQLGVVLQGADAVSVDVLLTHHHDDHEGGADDLVAALTSRGVRVCLRGGASGSRLIDGAMIGSVQVVLVPGHTSDSAAFVWVGGEEAVVFSGDTVLGGSSSFVAHPDGDLSSYLLSLDVLSEAVSPWPAAVLAPGHGGVEDAALPAIDAYRSHREERLAAVRAVASELRRESEGPVERGRADGVALGQADSAMVERVIREVYEGVSPALRPATEAVVRAQLAHLERVECGEGNASW